MANTITKQNIIAGSRNREVYITLLSDGTQETNTILYDPTSSPFSTAAAYIGTKIRRVSVVGACAAASKSYLTWDATTAVAAMSIPAESSFVFDTMQQGLSPLKNMGGSGVTGKIGITTLALAAGDTITIVLDILNE